MPPTALKTIPITWPFAVWGLDMVPFLFGDTPLKDSGCAFLIKFSLMDLVGFRSPNYAAGLILVFGKFLPN